MKFVVKSRSFMGDYIALNWLEPKISKEFGIKEGQIFVREDWWKNPNKRLRIRIHETTEIWLRKKWHLSYQQAHHLATITEHEVFKDRGLKLNGGKIEHKN
ncbi:MAG: hypothetical protein ACYDAO_02720 [Thermoplasmataceae archaeon]